MGLGLGGGERRRSSSFRSSINVSLPVSPVSAVSGSKLFRLASRWLASFCTAAGVGFLWLDGRERAAGAVCGAAGTASPSLAVARAVGDRERRRVALGAIAAGVTDTWHPLHVRAGGRPG